MASSQAYRNFTAILRLDPRSAHPLNALRNKYGLPPIQFVALLDSLMWDQEKWNTTSLKVAASRNAPFQLQYRQPQKNRFRAGRLTICIKAWSNEFNRVREDVRSQIVEQVKEGMTIVGKDGPYLPERLKSLPNSPLRPSDQYAPKLTISSVCESETEADAALKEVRRHMSSEGLGNLLVTHVGLRRFVEPHLRSDESYLPFVEFPLIGRPQAQKAKKRAPLRKHNARVVIAPEETLERASNVSELVQRSVRSPARDASSSRPDPRKIPPRAESLENRADAFGSTERRFARPVSGAPINRHNTRTSPRHEERTKEGSDAFGPIPTYPSLKKASPRKPSARTSTPYDKNSNERSGVLLSRW